MLLKNYFFFTAPRSVKEIESLKQLAAISLIMLGITSFLSNIFIYEDGWNEALQMPYSGYNSVSLIRGSVSIFLDFLFFYLLSFAYRIATRIDFNAEDETEKANNELANFAVKRDALLASQLLSLAYLGSLFIIGVDLLLPSSNNSFIDARDTLIFAAHFLIVVYFMPKIIQTEKAKKLKKGWPEDYLTPDTFIFSGYIVSAITYFVTWLVCYVILRNLVFIGSDF